MNRREAKQHWNTRTSEWKVWAEALVTELQEIEDPAFRHCVAGLLDACASGWGNVLVRRQSQNNNKINLVRISLDPEVLAALEKGVRTFNAEVDFPKLLDEVDTWLKTKLKSTNAIQVAWTIGPLRDVSPYEKDSLKTIVIDHIVYDVKKGQFVGVKFEGGVFTVRV